MSEPGRFVIDTSVAIKWYIPETGSDRAARILESDYELLAPELMLIEFGNVLWKKVQRRELGAANAREILDRRVASRRISYFAIPPLLGSAFDIAARYSHPIYDALYLAAAVGQDCRLVTADERLMLTFRNTPIEPFIVSLMLF